MRRITNQTQEAKWTSSACPLLRRDRGLWVSPAPVICAQLVFGSAHFLLPADPIDIVKDYIPPHEYLVEEDPKLYQSLKTKRGPLSDDWIEEIQQGPGQTPVMCAYKLCKVEFRYWGMQSKIERFIHDVGRSSRARTRIQVLTVGSSQIIQEGGANAAPAC